MATEKTADGEHLLMVMHGEGVEATTKLVLGLTDAQRRELAPQVTVLVRAAARWWEDGNEFAEYLKTARKGPDGLTAAVAIAAAGTVIASKLPGVLRRIEVLNERAGWGLSHRDEPDGLTARLVKVLEARGLVGRPKLAADLAGRVRAGDVWSRAWFFHLALELARRCPGEPPTPAVFSLLWLTDPQRVLADVRARPAWSVLALRALAVRDAGRRLDHSGLRQALTQLATEGLIPRADLLDACIGALQTTDRKIDLHGLMLLHDEIAPTADEIAARTGQYLSLVAGAPANVATVAQQRLRALDEAGRLPGPVLAATTTAIMVRPDKGLFRGQLTWLRSAMKASAGREPLMLAMAAGLGHPDPALQKRVLDLLDPFLSDLTGPARAELALAAEALAPDLRARAAGRLGVEAPGPGFVAELPGPQPVAALVPITGPEETVEKLTVYEHQQNSWGQNEFRDMEVLLDALVRFSWSCPERLHEALQPLLSRLTWLPEGPPPRSYGHRSSHSEPDLGSIWDCVRSARARAERLEPELPGARSLEPALPRTRSLGPELLGTVFNPQLGAPEDRPARPVGSVKAEVILFRRISEAASGMWWAPVPVLLATPTTVDGVLEADELVRRLQLLEEAGCRPWPDDLGQAWLRVRPGDRGRVLEVVRRVAGPEAAERLIGLGSAGAKVRLENWFRPVDQPPYAYLYGREPQVPTMTSSPVVTLTPAPVLDLPEPWNHLWRLAMPGPVGYQRPCSWLTYWPTILPFDRDVMAAHLVREVPGLKRGGGDVLRAHAEVAGPIGPATLLLYGYGLDLPEAEDRAGTSEALITTIGRGELDPVAFGETLGRLVAGRNVKLNRVVETLRGVGQAGGWATLWPILAAALPLCLPRAQAEPLARFADLLALAVEAAQSCGATGEVPGLDDVAGRRSTSRVRAEARRLQAALSGARAS
ncbi:DUF6493 family protein [Kineosporia sp. NBRC 101731]|uniref:DUF6493 family protein n=1 Tax=Kineosporia sp. NBRC 101731 TaxID=3032199 RepID=UPI0024A37F3F|nr:DUF6493 family protein [Kineosporia sp. NBRC 101731]GLY28719.1 hypothetical protein Kisp02_20840 [Kineosporia sp. NBRC 101731]